MENKNLSREEIEYLKSQKLSGKEIEKAMPGKPPSKELVELAKKLKEAQKEQENKKK